MVKLAGLIMLLWGHYMSRSSVVTQRVRNYDRKIEQPQLMLVIHSDALLECYSGISWYNL